MSRYSARRMSTKRRLWIWFVKVAACSLLERVTCHTETVQARHDVVFSYIFLMVTRATPSSADGGGELLVNRSRVNRCRKRSPLYSWESRTLMSSLFFFFTPTYILVHGPWIERWSIVHFRPFPWKNSNSIFLLCSELINFWTEGKHTNSGAAVRYIL